MKPLKRLYLMINNHILTVVRLWFIFLIPCAFSEWFSRFMLTLNIAVWLLMLAGKSQKWDAEIKG